MFTQVLVLTILLGAPAEPPAENDLRDQVRENVKQLRGDELRDRDAAERKLIELGTKALDHLPAANDDMPEEMRQRLARVRLKLEQARAQAAADGTRVTLKVDKKPLAEVLKMLEKLSDNRIALRAPEGGPGEAAAGNSTISLDVKNVPFWEALDQVLDQAGLTTDLHAREDNKPLRAVAITQPLAKAGGRAKRANYSGALRFEPVMITSRRGLADPDASGLQVQIEAAWEPRLMPIVLTFPRDSVRITLDDGKQLKSSQDGVETMSIRGSGTQFFVQTDLPARGAHSIKVLSGKLNVLVPGGMESFRCGPLNAGFKSREKKGGATVSIDRVAKNGDAWEVRLRLKFDDPAGALQSHLLDWVQDNETWLETPDGKKVESGSFQSIGEGEDEYGVSYVFPLPGDIKGHTFVYRTPAALVEKSIQFELKNIELP